MTKEFPRFSRLVLILFKGSETIYNKLPEQIRQKRSMLTPQFQTMPEPLNGFLFLVEIKLYRRLVFTTQQIALF